MKGRKYPDYGVRALRAPDVSGLLDYINKPRLIGALISGRMATLCELQSVYGIMDAYDLLEIMQVDFVNEFLVKEHGRYRN